MIIAIYLLIKLSVIIDSNSYELKKYLFYFIKSENTRINSKLYKCNNTTECKSGRIVKNNK